MNAVPQRQQSRIAGRWETGLALGVMALSLVLRLMGLNVFVTPDEDRWYDRSRAFHNALRSGDLAQTLQSPHPGVVTMWIGTAAIRLSGVEDPGLYADYFKERQQAAERTGEPQQLGLPSVLVRSRAIVAVVTWLCLGASYLLVRKLFDGATALVGLALLALDPFFLAHARLHHLDALLASFMTLSVLGLAIYLQGGKWRYLALSAVAGGLAIANKSPGGFLAPLTALVLALDVLLTPSAERGGALGRAALALVAWGALAGAVVVALWPALWVAPREVLRVVIEGALGYAENPHENLNYFWFAMRPDPGPAFYPVAWAFRTTPLVLLGLLAAALWARGAELHRRMLPLLLLALGFGLFMTLGNKKFDRYLLPSFLAGDVVAAAGLLALWRRLSLTRALAPAAFAAGLALAGAALVVPTYPYYLSYYNPALGGQAAEKILLIGWGEGMDLAAAYLNALPNAANLYIAAWQHERVRPFFAGYTVNSLDVALAQPDYYVYSANQLQRGLGGDSYAVLASDEPEYVVTLNGVDQAWVYRNTIHRQEQEEALRRIHAQADAATDMILLDLDTYLSRNYDGPLPLRVVAGPPREDFVLTGLQTATAGHQRVWFLTLPDSPADTRGMMRAHLREHATLVASFREGDVRVEAYALRDDRPFVPEPQVSLDAHLGEHVRLLGYDLLDPPDDAGALRLRLYWQADAPLDRGYHVFVHLLGPDGEIVAQDDGIPQGSAGPTFLWPAGQVVLDDHNLAPAPQGAYTLAVGLYDVDSLERLPVTQEGELASDGSIRVTDLSVDASSSARN